MASLSAAETAPGMGEARPLFRARCKAPQIGATKDGQFSGGKPVPHPGGNWPVRGPRIV